MDRTYVLPALPIRIHSLVPDNADDIRDEPTWTFADMEQRRLRSSLTRTIARDLGEHRIRVNAIVPGWIMTERQKQLWVTDEAIAGRRAKQCLPDLIDPVYVANMALFLASDDSAMCTASDFRVEAGSI